MPNGPTNPWSQSNSSSLRENQGDSLVTLSREMEFVRNDRARGNIDDQFTQGRDVRNGDAELIATWRQLAEYNRQLEANIDERPLHAAFIIAVDASDQRHWTTASNAYAKNSPPPAKSPSATIAVPKPSCGRPSTPLRPPIRPPWTSSPSPPPPKNDHGS